MKLRCARRQVAEAEAALIAQRQRLSEQWNAMNTHAKAAVTPTRLIVGGLVSGAIVGGFGLHRPVARLASGVRLTQLFSSVWALIGALQAKFAAEQAEAVADQAQNVAAVAAGTVAEATIATKEPELVADALQAAAEARAAEDHPHALRDRGTVAATVEAISGASGAPTTVEPDGAVTPQGAIAAALEEPCDPALRAAPPARGATAARR